jgi:hypothetical protein
MFGMNKEISKHCLTPSSGAASARPKKKRPARQKASKPEKRQRKSTFPVEKLSPLLQQVINREAATRGEVRNMYQSGFCKLSHFFLSRS